MTIKSRTHRFVIALVSLCLMLMGATALAQYRASLQGTVTDAQGAVVPGATVTLVDKETNRTLTVVTNQDGVVRLQRAGAAPYTLDVELEGFKKAVLEDVRIRGRAVEHGSTCGSRSAARRRPSTSPPPRR